jgi:hypothetical protein
LMTTLEYQMMGNELSLTYTINTWY